MTALTLGVDAGKKGALALMAPEAVAAVADATRLRSLAATFDGHLNRGKTFLGAEVAAMLRDGGA